MKGIFRSGHARGAFVAISPVLLIATSCSRPEGVAAAGKVPVPVSAAAPSDMSVRLCRQDVELGSVCRVAMDDLLVSDAFNGRQLEIAGYLVIDRNRLVMYPTEGDFLARNERKSLMLRAPKERQRQWFSLFANAYVHLRGRFEADEPSAHMQGRLGAVFVDDIQAARVDSKRESIDDLAVDLDDVQ